MRYSIEPRERRCVKDYGFLSFAKNIGKNISNKYGKKLLILLKNLHQMHWSFNKSNTKRVEATEDLVGNKIADKITSYSKKPTIESNTNEANSEIRKERYISPKERQQIIDKLRLIY